MVHALLECWRVLETDGILIDLRPFHSNPALEVITADEVFVPGHIDDSGGAADDIAADEAMTEVVGRGQFTLIMQDSFKFADYWDTLEGLLEHADERWRDHACIPPFVVEAARRCVAVAGSQYQIRVSREMHIAVYRKQAPVRRS
jgi:hypothetical protein